MWLLRLVGKWVNTESSCHHSFKYKTRLSANQHDTGKYVRLGALLVWVLSTKHLCGRKPHTVHTFRWSWRLSWYWFAVYCSVSTAPFHCFGWGYAHSVNGVCTEVQCFTFWWVWLCSVALLQGVSLFVVLPMRCSGLMLWCPWWAQTLFCHTVSGIVSLLVALPMKCSGLMLCCRWWAQLHSAAWQLDTGALCAEVQCFKHVLGEWGTVRLFQDILGLIGFLADGCNAFGCGVLVEFVVEHISVVLHQGLSLLVIFIVLNYSLVVFAGELRKAPFCCHGAFFAVLVVLEVRCSALRLVWLGRAPLCCRRVLFTLLVVLLTRRRALFTFCFSWVCWAQRHPAAPGLSSPCWWPCCWGGAPPASCPSGRAPGRRRRQCCGRRPGAWGRSGRAGHTTSSWSWLGRSGCPSARPVPQSERSTALKKGITASLYSSILQNEHCMALKQGIPLSLYSHTPQSERSTALKNGITASLYSSILQNEHYMALKEGIPLSLYSQHLKVNAIRHWKMESLYYCTVPRLRVRVRTA